MTLKPDFPHLEVHAGIKVCSFLMGKAGSWRQQESNKTVFSVHWIIGKPHGGISHLCEKHVVHFIVHEVETILTAD